MAKKFIVGLVLLFFCITVFPAVTINIVVVNPSGDEEKTIPVKQYLPAEITKEDIIDSNGLDIDYDVHEAKYFLYGKPKLAPKESMKYRVVLKDVWNIMTDQIEQLSAIVDKKVANASAEDKSAAQVVAD
ncbi:MAG: hypothetical protein PHZ27_06185, partial [Candidatus Omnitrophica bacterium]|nr:hypothetical protein [Candidatus Omnitrophota bacterium]